MPRQDAQHTNTNCSCKCVLCALARAARTATHSTQHCPAIVTDWLVLDGSPFDASPSAQDILELFKKYFFLGATSLNFAAEVTDNGSTQSGSTTRPSSVVCRTLLTLLLRMTIDKLILAAWLKSTDTYCTCPHGLPTLARGVLDVANLATADGEALSGIRLLPVAFKNLPYVFNLFAAPPKRPNPTDPPDAFAYTLPTQQSSDTDANVPLSVQWTLALVQRGFILDIWVLTRLVHLATLAAFEEHAYHVIEILIRIVAHITGSYGEEGARRGALLLDAVLDYIDDFSDKVACNNDADSQDVQFHLFASKLCPTGVDLESGFYVLPLLIDNHNPLIALNNTVKMLHNFVKELSSPRYTQKLPAVSICCRAWETLSVKIIPLILESSHTLLERTSMKRSDGLYVQVKGTVDDGASLLISCISSVIDTLVLLIANRPSDLAYESLAGGAIGYSTFEDLSTIGTLITESLVILATIGASSQQVHIPRNNLSPMGFAFLSLLEAPGIDRQAVYDKWRFILTKSVCEFLKQISTLKKLYSTEIDGTFTSEKRTVSYFLDETIIVLFRWMVEFTFDDTPLFSYLQDDIQNTILQCLDYTTVCSSTVVSRVKSVFEDGANLLANVLSYSLKTTPIPTSVISTLFSYLHQRYVSNFCRLAAVAERLHQDDIQSLMERSRMRSYGCGDIHNRASFGGKRPVSSASSSVTSTAAASPNQMETDASVNGNKRQRTTDDSDTMDIVENVENLKTEIPISDENVILIEDESDPESVHTGTFVNEAQAAKVNIKQASTDYVSSFVTMNALHVRQKCFGPFIKLILELRTMLSDISDRVILINHNDAEEVLSKLARLSSIVSSEMDSVLSASSEGEADTIQTIALKSAYRSSILLLVEPLLSLLVLIEDYADKRIVLKANNEVLDTYGVSWIANLVSLLLKTSTAEMFSHDAGGPMESESDDHNGHIVALLGLMKNLDNLYGLDFKFRSIPSNKTGAVPFTVWASDLNLGQYVPDLQYLKHHLLWITILGLNEHITTNSSKLLDFKIPQSERNNSSSSVVSTQSTGPKQALRLNFSRWCSFCAVAELPQMINKSSFPSATKNHQDFCSSTLVHNTDIMARSSLLNGKQVQFLLSVYLFALDAAELDKMCLCYIDILEGLCSIYLDVVEAKDVELEYAEQVSTAVLDSLSRWIKLAITSTFVNNKVDSHFLGKTLSRLVSFIDRLTIVCCDCLKKVAKTDSDQGTSGLLVGQKSPLKRTNSKSTVNRNEGSLLYCCTNLIDNILDVVFSEITTMESELVEDRMYALSNANYERCNFAKSICDMYISRVKPVIQYVSSLNLAATFPKIINRQFLLSCLLQLAIFSPPSVATLALDTCIAFIDFQREHEVPRWDDSALSAIENCSGNGLNMKLLRMLSNYWKEEDELQVKFLHAVTESISNARNSNELNSVQQMMSSRQALSPNMMKVSADDFSSSTSLDVRLSNAVNCLQSLYLNSQSETICGDVLVFLCLQLAVFRGRHHKLVRKKLQEIARVYKCSELTLLTPFLREISINMYLRVLTTPEKLPQYASFGPFSEFHKSAANFVIPLLVYQQSTPIIEALGKILGISVADLLLDKVGYIFSYVLVKHRNSIPTVVDYFCQRAGINSIGPALRSAQFPLIKEIALQLRLSKPRAMEGQRKSGAPRNGVSRAIFARVDSVPSFFNQEAKKVKPPIENMSRDEFDEEDEAVKALNAVRGFLSEDRDLSDNSSDSLLVRHGGSSLSSYLHFYFVGLLNEIATQIDPENLRVTLRRRIDAFEAFGKLIQLVGPIVTTFEPQIRTIFEMAMRIPQLRSQALGTWHILLDILDPKDLENLLDTICISLCKGIEHFSVFHQMLVAETLEDILVTKQRSMNAKLENLCLLPIHKVDSDRIPLFVRLSQIILDAKSSLSPIDQFTILLPKISDADATVVTRALESFLVLIHANEVPLSAVFLSEGVDGVLKYTVKLLLETSGRFLASEPSVSRLCSKALGALGAIDPSRIDFDVQARTFNTLPLETDSQRASVLEELQRPEMMLQYVFRLLDTELAPGTRSATSQRLQKNMAYATQELLKLVMFTPEVVNLAESDRSNLSATNAMVLASIHSSSKNKSMLDFRVKLWRQFNPKNLPILKSLLKSNFTRQKTVYTQKDTIFYPRVGTYAQWLQLWVVELIKRMPEGPIRGIFECCTGSIQSGGISVAQFILPQVLLNTIIRGTDVDRKFVQQEFQTVLVQTTNTQQDLNEKDHLALQTLFFNLDALTKWLRKQQRDAAKLRDMANRSRNVDHETTATSKHLELVSSRVEMFLMNIPKLHLAEASFKCKGYARAVLHFEEYLRARRHEVAKAVESVAAAHPTTSHISAEDEVSKNLDVRSTSTGSSLSLASADVSTVEKQVNIDHTNEIQVLYAQLQKIYAHVGEPDGVRGLNEMLLRPGLSEQILTNEASGNWANAQGCYERLLELEPDNLQVHLGLLRCYKNQGNLGSVAMHVRGMQSEQPEWRGEMIPYGIEAAWRLGRWDELESMCKERHKWNFEGALGYLLLTAKRSLNSFRQLDKGNIEQVMGSDCPFWGELEQVRSKLTLELGTASMDSYRRSYDSVIKLHILHEIEAAVANTLADIASSADDVQTLPHETNANWATYLDNRLKLTTLNFLVREPILNVRCLLLGQNLMVSDIVLNENKLWLQIAKEARKTQYFQFAHSAILRAGDPTSPYVVRERAKLLWSQNKRHEAINLLDDYLGHSLALQKVSTDTIVESEPGLPAHSAMPSIKAKIELLRVIWMEATSRGKSEIIISAYSSVVKSSPAWEKSAFYLGKYYNTIFDTEVTRLKARKVNASDSFLTQSVINFALNVCRYYGKALTYGCKFYYQSMSRLLTLWLNLGRDVMPLVESLAEHKPAEGAPPKRKGRRANAESEANTAEWLKDVERRLSKFSQINTYICRLASKLPAYQFLGAMSQLASRIGHSNAEVHSALETIISNVFLAYPHQTFWSLVAVANSTDKVRSTRVLAIFEKVQTIATRNPESANPDVIDIITNGPLFASSLIELCNCTIPKKESTFSISTRFRALKRMLPLNLIVPLQMTMTMSLPTKIPHGVDTSLSRDLPSTFRRMRTNRSDVTPLRSGSVPSSATESSAHISSFIKNFEPFPMNKIFILDVEDEVEVLASLQRPKKLTVHASDGIKYSFLCKPKDDLRKDSRLMEFNTMINMLLRKDQKSRKRKLQIRTYSVTPLNEECGLIEWVQNTIGFRSIVQNSYKARGINVPPLTIKKLLESKDPAAGGVTRIFVEKVLPQFPPIFHEWFIETFPDPTQWLAARARYAATTATMSMVGYIVGLGDRHGENILFDDQTGDCVHVDLNCLFEKGLKFEVPERVPFRLTQNMVDALGVTGTKGVFESCCDISLHILRSNKDSLMSTLETFLFDPLCEWSRAPRPSTSVGDAASRGRPGMDWSAGDNEEALQALNVIQRKLDGSIVPGLPLSVEGQVRELISQATSNENLSQMYIGWMSYL